MALPVCTDCAKRRLLCASCESKLSSGLINEYDVEASRALYGLLGDGADFRRAIPTEDFVAVIAKADDVGSVIGRGGDNIRVLSERLGRPVRVVGEDDFEEMVRALIAPARIKGVNEVFKPGGGRKIRVRVNAEDRKKLRMGVEDLRNLLSSLADAELDLTFDL
ncbi:MAG: transcription elongation factor NusA [Candidatus Altiarchaeales archaeon]|nr:transcription elongation factor NusA [Candidatus Altiarchaeales archaeon]MBD3415672.1 transcription elongation factor NusA [Candidatus Altiarchaeales archaeon]